jgi:hypothetical protein
MRHPEAVSQAKSFQTGAQKFEKALRIEKTQIFNAMV